MQRLNRALQRHILEHLREHYPDPAVRLMAEPWLPDTQDFWGNVKYLVEHDLVAVMGAKSLEESPRGRALAITHKGLDFLEDDGGLSAILGVVTVKLHADTVRDLLAKRIAAAPMPPEQKAAWLEKLKALPAQAVERVVLRLAEAGADRGWKYLRSVLEQVA